MPQLINTRPTKIELIKLRRRLVLATRIQKIVKDKLLILTLEFLQTARETTQARRRLLDRFIQAYKALTITAGYHGYITLEKEIVASERDLEITTGSRNIAGAKVPSLELKKAEGVITGYNIADTSSYVDQTAHLSRRCIEEIVTLAELQASLEALGRETNRTKRIFNALEHLIIPSLQATIKHLYIKFEERDREEKSRLKRVKVLLEQR